MAQTIVNAAAMVIDRGTEDLSTRQVPREPVPIPQHLPKFYVFGEKGDDKPHLVVGAELERMLGTKTFDTRGKFFNHATLFLQASNAEGNANMVQRLVPEDAGPASNLIAWLDVLPTTVDIYERNIDGSIKLNNLNDPIIVGTGAGYKVKWVVSASSTQSDADAFGQRTITPGDQVDPVTNTQSQRFPIFEIKASSQGQTFNLAGLRFWAQTTKNVQALPTQMMAQYSAYPYFMSVIRRPDPNSAPKVVKTLFGEQQVMVTFKENVFDPTTDVALYAGDTFIDSYQNLTDIRYPVLRGEFGDMYIYQSNLEALLEQFHAAEIPYIDGFTDFTEDPEQKHLFNFATGVTSSGTPYHSFVFVDSPSTVRFSETTNVYLQGGSDGTMDLDSFNTLVKNELARYLDPDDEVQDLVKNPESVMYDSGFTMDTKLSMGWFISQRRDTRIVVGTHVSGEVPKTASEEHSRAVSLRTRFQMYPESDYFGTPVMRASIFGRAGLVRNSQYKQRVPVTYEILKKSARYMGAGVGRYTGGESFEGAPGHIISDMYDFNITWVPNSVRNRNWDVGLNWIQLYDLNSYMFPAYKTVYDNDTSVLTSMITTAAICEVNKVSHAAWREFTGRSDLSSAQLIDQVNAFVRRRTEGRFDGRFVIVPDCQITEYDALRGYSFTLVNKFYANNMITVMTTYVQAFRMSDLGT